MDIFLVMNMQKTELLEYLRSLNLAKNIVQAFANVERKEFVPAKYQPDAYDNSALPIGYGQTISQPYTIAFMLNLLDIFDKQKILEIGSGSGYVLALLAQIAKNAKIFGTERIKELADSSRLVLAKYKNIKVLYTPSDLGLPTEAPFDRILVSATAQKLEKGILSQLADDGILVCPIKDSIVRVQKINGQIKKEEYFGFAFVPLITK